MSALTGYFYLNNPLQYLVLLLRDNTMIQNHREFLGHPKGLFLLFSSELWERFSFYALRAVLILYVTDLTINGGLGWDKADALRLYGIYTGLIYITPLIGGWLADNICGQRKAIIYGAVLMASGQFILSLPNGFLPVSANIGLYIGLAFLICGNGLFKPNISTMVGDLYDPADTRRDSAFTIFYMGINIGSFLAGITAGFVSTQYSFKAAFAAAGIGMLIALFLQLFLSKRYLKNIGLQPDVKTVSVKQSGNTKLNAAEICHLKVIFILGLFSIIFWAGFEQAGGLINLYTAEHTDRSIGNYIIPTAFFQSLNPLFIIFLAPLFAWFWIKPGRKELHFVSKFVFALLFLGIGFLFMIGAVLQAEADPTGKASALWLVGMYLFHTIAELLLSPTGLSVVSRLAPVRYLSLMMGIWFGFSALANFIAGLIGSLVDEFGAAAIFFFFFAAALIAAGLLWKISKKLIKWAET